MKALANTLAALAATMSLGTVAHATDVSYDFLEVRFLDTEIDGSNADGDGFLLGGSYNFHENWLVIGSYTSQDFDGDVDLTGFEVGVGYVWPVDPQFDLFATGSFVDYEVEFGSFDASEDGLRLTGGIRSRFNEKFEGRAVLNYLDLDDSDTFIQLAGDYYFTDEFAFGITLDVGGDVDTITFGGRWFFGDRRVR
ncbi:MAG: outer membrane beta-barrel protein [Pseudomonadota bacterium]